MYGRKWARVAEAVPNRTQVQVRERFVNVLDPLLKRKKQWTPEEDAILVEALSDCKNADGSMRCLPEIYFRRNSPGSLEQPANLSNNL